MLEIVATGLVVLGFVALIYASFVNLEIKLIYRRLELLERYYGTPEYVRFKDGAKVREVEL